MLANEIKGADPRSLSPYPITPPEPLPYVSRRALGKVVDRVDPPKRCHLCGGGVVLCSNAEVYNGREYGDWPYVYRCVDCEARVGLHRHTDLPLGFLADAETIMLRRESKKEFMALVKQVYRNKRTPAYKWLAKQLGLPVNHCHFGFFDKVTAIKAGAICNKELARADFNSI